VTPERLRSLERLAIPLEVLVSEVSVLYSKDPVHLFVFMVVGVVVQYCTGIGWERDSRFKCV
jgi:hypothetical protein